MNVDELNNQLAPLLPRKMVYCDIGSRWGIGDPWKSFENLIQLISFEPDEEEYKALLGKLTTGNILYPHALYRSPQKISLNLTRARGASSIYEPNFEVLNNYPDAERYTVEKKMTVNATSLDTLYQQDQIKMMDFIKVDVQGAELDVLQGGEKLLSEHTLGIEVEVEFISLYKNQPLFAEVDSYIRQTFGGLQTQDIRKQYWKYKEGLNVGTTKGQLIYGDVLYFRSPETILAWCGQFNSKQATEKILMACFMGLLYGYLDYSLCLLSQPTLPKLLEATVIDRWKSVIYAYGKTLRHTNTGAVSLSHIFHLLYRLFQPAHQGWGTSEYRLGSRKKLGIFE